MLRDYTIVLWLLKLGGLINLYLLLNTSLRASGDADAYIVLPAQILFAVSAYRCSFPVWYEHNVVFHDSILSSIFVTRLLATFSEIGYVFLFSHVLRLLNIGRAELVAALSWLMVAQVVMSQGFVWAAILTEQPEFYYYEELGWAFIFAANTIASAYIYLTVGALAGREILLPDEPDLRHRVSAMAGRSPGYLAGECEKEQREDRNRIAVDLDAVGNRPEAGRAGEDETNQ